MTTKLTFSQGVSLSVEAGSIFMAIVTFIVGMGWVANDPYEGGIYGPLMALCAALMLLLISLDSDVTKRHRAVRGSLAAIFGGVSAYFWIADALGKRPTDSDVWLGLGLVWYLVLGYAVLAVMMIGIFISNHDD